MDMDKEQQRELILNCLKATIEHCQVGVFLTEVKYGEADEVKAELEVSRKVTDMPAVRFQMANGYAFVYLDFPHDCIESKSICHTWEEYLSKSTGTLENKTDDTVFMFVLNLTGIFEGATYITELANPAFMGITDNTIGFSFPIGNVSFHKAEVNEEMLDRELDYEERVRENRFDDLSETDTVPSEEPES